jgi:hypothetical protein
VVQIEIALQFAEKLWNWEMSACEIVVNSLFAAIRGRKLWPIQESYFLVLLVAAAPAQIPRLRGRENAAIPGIDFMRQPDRHCRTKHEIGKYQDRALWAG